MPRLSRRGMFAASAVLAVPVAAVAAPIAPDADLFAACRRFDAASAEEMRLSRVYADASAEGDHDAEVSWSEADAVLDKALQALMAITPATTEGLLAKTRCVWAYWERNAQFLDEETIGLPGEAAFRVLRDCALLTVPLVPGA